MQFESLTEKFEKLSLEKLCVDPFLGLGDAMDMSSSVIVDFMSETFGSFYITYSTLFKVHFKVLFFFSLERISLIFYNFSLLVLAYQGEHLLVLVFIDNLPALQA